MSDGLAGVVLAAGAGTRLAPLTSLRPKALCPVGNVPLVDHALARLTPYAGDLAVNVHHGRDAMVAHLAGRVHLSVEEPVALGTAGALGALRGWLDGRDVLLTNADSYLGVSELGVSELGVSEHGVSELGVSERALDGLVTGWDGERVRLLTVAAGRGQRGDFGEDRYVGACLLPWRLVAGLEPVPTGLYELMWRRESERGALDLVRHGGVAIDCGTPSDYLRANLDASGGASVVGAGAVVEGRLVRSVVWPGCRVDRGEQLVEQVRGDGGLTVDAPLG